MNTLKLEAFLTELESYLDQVMPCVDECGVRKVPLLTLWYEGRPAPVLLRTTPEFTLRADIGSELHVQMLPNDLRKLAYALITPEDMLTRKQIECLQKWFFQQAWKPNPEIVAQTIKWGERMLSVLVDGALPSETKTLDAFEYQGNRYPFKQPRKVPVTRSSRVMAYELSAGMQDDLEAFEHGLAATRFRANARERFREDRRRLRKTKSLTKLKRNWPEAYEVLENAQLLGD